MSKYLFAAKLSQLKENVIFSTVVDETPVALTLLDGAPVAFGDVCTHDDGPLNDGTIENRCVICPRHGARFSLIDGRATFPAVAPLPIYKTQIDGGDVKIEI